MCSFYNPNVQATYESDTSFMHLKKMELAEYGIVYRINDCYHVTELSDFRLKQQLLFQRFVNIQQQRNLMYVDSVFPLILADLVLDVFLQKIKSFEEYVPVQKQFSAPDLLDAGLYYNFKLRDFIEFLLYSDIAQTQECTGLKNYDTVFGAKNTEDELEFYTLYERLKLYDYLMKNMQLEIDIRKSELTDTEVTLYLKIGVL
jgi:hypothetical protein